MITFYTTENDHVVDVEVFLTFLIEEGVTPKLMKCELFKTKFHYLGHVKICISMKRPEGACETDFDPNKGTNKVVLGRRRRFWMVCQQLFTDRTSPHRKSDGH